MQLSKRYNQRQRHTLPKLLQVKKDPQLGRADMGPFGEPYYKYSTGGNLTIFNKDHDITEEGRSQIALSPSEVSSSYSQA